MKTTHLFKAALFTLVIMTSSQMFASTQSTMDTSIRAHKTTWSSLMGLNQINDSFNNVGHIRIEDYTVWHSYMNDATIEMFAQQLDSVFVETRGAKRLYPDDNYIECITDILFLGKKNKEDTKWFADKMDDLYEFYGEESE